MKHALRPSQTQRSATRHGRIGLELEFAGLTEADAAAIVAETTGGTARQTGPQRWDIATPIFGGCTAYLDTRLDGTVGKLAGDAGLSALRHVVPVELVTEPFCLRHLPAFDRVTAALRDNGAEGSRDGMLYGFGTHLNIEVDPDDIGALVNGFAAYALIEQVLRDQNPIDVSRRLLPFVDPYPASLVDAVAERLPRTVEDLLDLYLAHAPSRDHGLDLLPILALFDADRVQDVAGGRVRIKSRPAFHFRLPDCRIDEAGWSVRDAWKDWRLVQQVARDADRLDALRSGRRAWMASNVLRRASWSQTASAILCARNAEPS